MSDSFSNASIDSLSTGGVRKFVWRTSLLDDARLAYNKCKRNGEIKLGFISWLTQSIEFCINANFYLYIFNIIVLSTEDKKLKRKNRKIKNKKQMPFKGKWRQMLYDVFFFFFFSFDNSMVGGKGIWTLDVSIRNTRIVWCIY